MTLHKMRDGPGKNRRMDQLLRDLVLCEPHERMLAARTLGEIGNPSALEALRERHRNDSSKAVRFEADRAINKIMRSHY